MSQFLMYGRCYDQIADAHGADIAQLLWQRKGNQGQYVPGYVALEQWSDKNGLVVGYTDWARSNQLLNEIIAEKDKKKKLAPPASKPPVKKDEDECISCQ